MNRQVPTRWGAPPAGGCQTRDCRGPSGPENLPGLDRLRSKPERAEAYVAGHLGRAQGEGREELIVALAGIGFDQRGHCPEYCPLPRDPIASAAGLSVVQAARTAPESLGGRLKSSGRICKRNATHQQRGNARQLTPIEFNSPYHSTNPGNFGPFRTEERHPGRSSLNTNLRCLIVIYTLRNQDFLTKTLTKSAERRSKVP